MPRPFMLIACAISAAAEVEPAKLATADASPLAPGAWEVAVGVSWSAASRARDAEGRLHDRGGRWREGGIACGVTVGVADGIDAGAGLGWTRIADDAADPSRGAGPADLELGSKWRILQVDAGEAAGAVALLPVLTAPLGRGQRADERIPTASRCWTSGVGLAASGHVGIVALNAEAGWVHALGGPTVRGGYRRSIVANLALGVQVAESLQPEVELNWRRDAVETAAKEDDGTARTVVEGPWSLAATAGVQAGLPLGRLGLGVQRTVAGSRVDDATAIVAELAAAF